jgi:hypothetical protein
MSSYLALRVLCGTLVGMALADVPVAVSPETGQVIGALALAMVLASLAPPALRRRARPGVVGQGRDPERKHRVLVGQIR